ncbi:MAG TPA: ORF6N domain-containing protein [Mariniphaga anaerophila]|uniref:ORF6N domain-containing protein n=1 Tax=Mariniphaga anaerophila TaxID=1484053 RepID=A0A831LL96_9BACT|nr:ORF6N domain-containing protein [Mariniphaga anaerophila]
MEEQIAKSIHLIREQKVMLDSDLAEMYGVETKSLKRAVRRNIARFPEDFMFELTGSEWENLRCQFGTSKEWGGSRYPPFVFTEQGIAMLSSVLNSPQAIQVNISIMRIFVKMRKWAANYSELVKKIEELQNSESEQNQHIARIYQIIEELVKPKMSERKPIGYKAERER